MPKQAPPFLTHFGLWDVGNIRVQYISPSWVQFSCKHLIVNGDREIKNVFYTIIDRLRGVDFDEKVEHELQRFISKMRLRNKRISELKEKSTQLQSKI